MTDSADSSNLAADGYRMPPEWHPHTCTWMAWPHNPHTWPKRLAQAQQEFRQLLAAIARDEPVRLLVPSTPEPHRLDADDTTDVFSSEQIELIQVPTNDAWMRDYGPTFLLRPDPPRLAAVDWQYNAWGNKYPPFDDDQQVVRRILPRIAHSKPVRHAPQPLVLEGGALEIDDRGVLLTTTSCVLNANRNPGLDRAAATQKLQETLGAQHVIWLTGTGLLGDDTDGHIDQLARFTPSRSILFAWSADPHDPQHAAMARHRFELEQQLSAAGLTDELIPLPLPDPVTVDGQRLPASYCNFYITRHSVLVPRFDVRQDAIAQQIIAQQFPDHRVISLPSRYLTLGLGSFHCLTQQQPHE